MSTLPLSATYPDQVTSDPARLRIVLHHREKLIPRKRQGTRARPCRVLLVTPEISRFPTILPGAESPGAKAGGLAEMASALFSQLQEVGMDVHLAVPNYRRLLGGDFSQCLRMDRVHFAEDRHFYYRGRVYSNNSWDLLKLSLAFQREVINHIIPKVQPDLVHCHDWMTGLIPAAARCRGIKSLPTIHNVHTQKATLATMEDQGIDAAEFWINLYYDRPPYSYEETRDSNPADFLASGIFSADYVNVVSQRFLQEITLGWHDNVPHGVREEIRAKVRAGRATGILNAPDASYDPRHDPALARRYDLVDVVAGKAENKRVFQKFLGLPQDPNAPLFFWPSRLDPVQKGPQLLTDCLHLLFADPAAHKLQIAIVADGEHKIHVQNVVELNGLRDRVAIADFRESVSRLGYAAADFILMPSLYEPCGLPQMIGPLYGALPIVHSTGGLADTVIPLDVARSFGNGFRFEVYGADGFRWAIMEALRFHQLPPAIREREVSRVMDEARQQFQLDIVTDRYRNIYTALIDGGL